MLRSARAHPALAGDVVGYRLVEDWAGVHAGRPIRTVPIPGAVLSVNFGRPNQLVGGPLAPRVSLLGVQSESRAWRSWERTSFVMAVLTLRGLVRLFPNAGGASAGQLVELGALVGDAVTHALADVCDAAERFDRIVNALDRWLLARLQTVQAPAERIVAALDALARHPVDAVAQELGVSRRQLHRWSTRHTGAAPKALADLYRLEASLRAVQTGVGDALAGFADQPHQIRAWRRRLGVTPGRYVRTTGSEMARAFAAPDALSFYL